MNLRSKILLVTGLLCAVLIGVASLIIAKLSLSSYARLERQSVERSLELAQHALHTLVTRLEGNAPAYSYWEDTQAFVKGQQVDYLEENGLLDAPPPGTDIDILVLSDGIGNIKFARRYTAEGGQDVEAKVLATLQPFLARQSDDNQVLSGVLMVAGEPALVVVSPLLDSAGNLPATGTMVMLSYLNQARLTELSKAVGSPLTLQVLNNQAPDISDAVGEWARDPKVFVVQAAGNSVKGFVLVSDIFQQPIVAWGVETPRTIYQQGLKNVLALLAVFALVGIAGVVAVTYLLERTVLNRLSALSKSVRSISETGDITARTSLEGKDELATLSQDINRMLASLEHQEEALRKSNQELEQFAYVASHDLQEPLRKVQAFSDRLASKYADKLDDDGKLYISRMQDASNRMRTLIQDLLAYSRIRSKGQEFIMVDLNEIVKGVISDLEVRLEQSSGRVEVGELPTVLADPLQMRQVFQNLIGNALKFKKSNVPPVVKVMAKLKNDAHIIAVQDNGIGFEQQYAERVFEIFQRLHGRSDFEGTGMGLAIVKKILERHVGSIRAKSEPGKGTVFVLTLPNHTDPRAMVKKTLIDDQPRKLDLADIQKELA